MYVGMYVCTYVCMYVCTYVCMYVRTYVCMYVCMYVRTYVCIYVCMYVCLYAIQLPSQFADPSPKSNLKTLCQNSINIDIYIFKTYRLKPVKCQGNLNNLPTSDQT